jgi:DNA-binding transcriptional ArsR family regulator
MTVVVDDELWAAIGDPTRRRVLDLVLTLGPSTASSLGRELPVTRQAVAKHLAVLERAQLIDAQIAGREVRYAVNPEQFARAVRQLAEVGKAWDNRLQRIKVLAESIQRSTAERRSSS